MMQDGAVDIDGTLSPAAEARVSVFDRGFLYGDSAFEVLRTYARRPFREREHLERLARSCRLLKIELPVALDRIAERAARAVAATGLPDCYLRLVVTRGVGPLGLELGQAQSPSVVIYALPLKPTDPELYRRGIAVGFAQTQRATDHTTAAGAKASNYLASVLALDELKARGFAEAIMLGSRGEVLEGATSNVFAVAGGRLFTPLLSPAILEGITRRTVLELCSEEGLPCEQCELRPEALQDADEVFITSSIREIVPVVRVEGRSIGDGQPGAITWRLLEAYRRLAQA